MISLFADEERQRKLDRIGESLNDCQARRNPRIAKVRERVEHLFPELYPMGGLMMRALDFARGQFQIATKLAAYHLKRWMCLRVCGMAAF